MIIKEVELDDLCRDEYLFFMKTLADYFYVMFNEEIGITTSLDYGEKNE